MIEIIINYENDRIKGFSVRGHSKTAPHGEDIVCAGVSAITQTALLGLGKHLKRNVVYSVKSGDMFAELKDAPDELTDAVLQTMCLGLKEIVKLYPKSVNMKVG